MLSHHLFRLAALVTWLYANAFAPAQSNLRFERLSLEHGVSHDLVFAIHQDRQGFMWFGTMYGLVKYDGRRYTVYKHDPADSNSISCNDIIAIHEDRNGHLWIGSWGGGLNRFDPAIEKFTRFVHDANDTNSVRDNMAWAIAEDLSGGVWIGTQTGLDKIVLSRPHPSAPAAQARFQHYRLPGQNSHSAGGAIRALLVDQSGRMWVGTAKNGLFCITNENGIERVRHYVHDAHQPASLSHNDITAIFQDRNGELWIGTGNGLNRMAAVSAGSADFQHYRHDPQNAFSLSHDHVGAIAEEAGANGTLWIGTGRGLNRFDRHTQTFTRYQHDPADSQTLRTNGIVALRADRSGILWVGAYFGGVHKLDTRGTPFAHVRHQPGKETSLSAGPVRALYEDGRGTLWVGTFGGGLNAVRAQQTKSRAEHVTNSPVPEAEHGHFRFDPRNPRGLRSNLITAITGDDSDYVWVGTQGGGLARIAPDQRMETYRSDPADSTSLSSNNVLSLYCDRAGELWVGTDNGVSRLHHDAGNPRRFTRYARSPTRPSSLSENTVHTIYEDRSGTLWLGTYRGLNRFDRQSQTFRHYRHNLHDPASLSNDYVYAIHEDRSGNLWVGTSDGLNHFDRATETFTIYNEKDGLPNGVICGILEDHAGRLWLSTNKGLSCFDSHLRAFKNYDISDGLQSNMFSRGACFQNRAGVMYFGGVNGYNHFAPEALSPDEFVPPVVLTEVRLFDKPVAPAQRTGGRLDLPHDQNFLAFEFAALSYARPEKNQYAYRLEGVDRDWVFSGTTNFASYTALRPGRYVFRVKGANHDGVWNENDARLAIVITPPFWRTWWFSCLMAGGLVASVYAWHRQRLRREAARIAEIEGIKTAEQIKRAQEVELARRQEREAVRKKIAADFHDESGHKLTKISLFCGVLQRKLGAGTAEIDEYLERIMKAAASLHQDLSDFIWSLDPAENSLYDTALKLKEFGDKLFDHTGICFEMPAISPELEQARLPMETRQNLMCIFKEGMNNILKHNRAACKNVRFEIMRSNGYFTVTLADDGTGFDCHAGGRGHGLRNMQERSAAVGGKLKILSAFGKGTTIQFTGALPPAAVARPQAIVADGRT